MSWSFATAPLQIKLKKSDGLQPDTTLRQAKQGPESTFLKQQQMPIKGFGEIKNLLQTKRFAAGLVGLDSGLFIHFSQRGLAAQADLAGVIRWFFT